MLNFVEYNDDKISKLALGTVQFGLDYGIANQNGKPSQQKVNEIINYITSQHINCFDTAQGYGDSESVLGNSINNIQNLLIISKLKSSFFQSNLYKNVENSIEKLNVSQLYGLLLHDSELLYNWTNQYSNDIKVLKEKNKIKYFGVSIYTDNDFQLAVKNQDIDLIQIPFNIFDQRAINNGWLIEASKQNKLIIIRSIYLQGLLLMDIDTVPSKLDHAKIYIEQFETLCKSLNMTKNELALAFVDTLAQESIILFGCDNIEQAEQNLQNYNNLPILNGKVLKKLSELFSNIDESIYNPTRW